MFTGFILTLVLALFFFVATLSHQEWYAIGRRVRAFVSRTPTEDTPQED